MWLYQGETVCFHTVNTEWTGHIYIYIWIYANIVHTSSSFCVHTHAHTHIYTFSYHFRTSNRQAKSGHCCCDLFRLLSGSKSLMSRFLCCQKFTGRQCWYQPLNHPIRRFSEAGLHELMPFVIFCARCCERSQRHFQADFWVGVASHCV